MDNSVECPMCDKLFICTLTEEEINDELELFGEIVCPECYKQK